MYLTADAARSGWCRDRSPYHPRLVASVRLVCEAQAAGRALELDATIAEAHLVLGEVALRRWQWTDAEARYRRALDLDPNNAAAHAGRARWLLSQRRTDEALEWAQRARELDPLAWYGRDIGWIRFQSRRYADAIREFQTVHAVQTTRESCGSSALR